MAPDSEVTRKQILRTGYRRDCLAPYEPWLKTLLVASPAVIALIKQMPTDGLQEIAAFTFFCLALVAFLLLMLLRHYRRQSLRMKIAWLWQLRLQLDEQDKALLSTIMARHRYLGQLPCGLFDRKFIILIITLPLILLSFGIFLSVQSNSMIVLVIFAALALLPCAVFLSIRWSQYRGDNYGRHLKQKLMQLSMEHSDYVRRFLPNSCDMNDNIS